MYSSKSAHRHVATPTTYVLRCLVVVTMIVAAATFLHINNYRPKQTFLSCDRPCHHLDWPMICRVKLTLEVFQSLSKSCGDCPLNQTACLAKHCVSADGQRRGILTANRQMPGPSIQVCENDILVVDVINRLPGKAVAVHWRGQTQMEMPYMDGVPLITQCPIPSYTTFQYKFRASSPGTHLWHAHAGADVTNGIFGSLIVKQADLREPHRALYDIDDPNHVVLVTHWQHSPEISFNQGHVKPAILLINGRGRQLSGPTVPLSTFTVISGRRHRFRVANAGGAGACPVTLFIDGHTLLLIAFDGHPIEPRKVTSITLAKGERADFVLKANKRVASYWMNVHTAKECGTSTVNGAALVNYKGNSEIPVATAETIDQQDIDEIGMKRLAVTTNPAECGGQEGLCVMDIQNMRKMPRFLAMPRMDVTMYLPINYKMQATELIGNSETETRVFNVDNSTFTFPSSPLLTQGDDVSPDMMCSNHDEDNNDADDAHNENNDTVSYRCRPVGDGAANSMCECVHVRRVPLGSTVEIILLDQGGLDDLVYHLHGYSFYVVGARQFGRSMSLQEVKKLDEKKQLFVRNLDCAPTKDTIVVPKFGAVALRFKADNPGYWMLRDEHADDWTRGLDVVLQVGESSDMIPAPQDFPKMRLNVTVITAILSSAVTVNPEGSEADSSVMSCLSALDSQLATLFSVPEEILFLRHKVFREYAKIAVGPDFIHTLPSFVIVAAALLVLWKNPPSSARLMDLIGVTLIYKGFQVSISWLMVTVLLWLWLILQRILYCSVWRYWSYETEHRDISYPWWQRVWSSYYPAPIQPPVMSACFISWIIAMSVGIIALGCAINIEHLEIFVKKIFSKLRDVIAMTKSYIDWFQYRMQQLLVNSEANAVTDDSEISSVCEDSRSETSTDVNAARGDVHPISYGTNWMPPPNFSMFKEAQRKISLKSFHTVTGVNDVQDPDKFAAKQFRHRRGCHTVIPSNSSEQSSEC